MREYKKVRAGCGYSSILPVFDFETYSEAGFYLDTEVTKKPWRPLVKGVSGGLPLVGSSVYSEHPSTKVLSLAYNLKEGRGARLWIPGMPAPQDLFDYIEKGGLLEAWNSAFEYQIWANVCHARMGWPALDYKLLRDAAAKARAFSVPGSLEKAGEVLEITNAKMKEGKHLIDKFCKPNYPAVDILKDDEADLLYQYNLRDIKAAAEISLKLPDLQPQELEMWLLDQKINFRGVHIDAEALDNCIELIRQAHIQYTDELISITKNVITTAGQCKRISAWINVHGVECSSLNEKAVARLLELEDLPPKVRRVLEIRASLSSTSVKKINVIKRMVSKDGRLRNLFVYCGADRTGRFSGRGLQPQNLPKSGPEVKLCLCGIYRDAARRKCASCGSMKTKSRGEWSPKAVDGALDLIASRDLTKVEGHFKNATGLVSSCIRGLLIAKPGYDFISSDYSAIDAVTLAELAGESWRQEVFRTHGKIYEMSAAKITGTPFQDFIDHKKNTGDHHPLRNKIGKFAELASGYQGWLGAWKMIGADEYLTDDEIKTAILAWREQSPAIVAFWAGLQDAATSAIRNPGKCFEFRNFKFGMKGSVLYCRLLSGRYLCYQDARAHNEVNGWGRKKDRLTYMGYVKKNWCAKELYGGNICAHIVSATTRDILVHALINLEKANYPVVLHVHDEAVSEVRKGYGSIEEFEKEMNALPWWARGWPIRATGGWRGKRFRKD